MGKLKQNKCFRSLFLVILVVVGMILVDQVYGLGGWVTYSLAPISVLGYFVSYYCGWPGAAMAIVGNMILAFYSLALAPNPNLVLGRHTIGLIANTIGYTLLAYQAESMFNLKAKKVILEDLQIAKFRIVFDEAKEHLLAAMTIIRRVGITPDQARESILKELDIALDRVAHLVTQSQVARTLANDKEKLGIE